MVIGGGVIGLEYASILAALDIHITLIEQRPTLLDFVDKQIIDALCYHLSQAGVIFRLGERVAKVGFDSEHNRVFTELESGKIVYGDALIYAVGRQANTDLLNLEAIGLRADERGRLRVNENFQTEIPHIYAAGDVIGFPALASTSMEQGRLASCHMFGQTFQQAPELIPYGIYTIPEVSMVGKTEAQLIAAKIPYAVGIAKYEDVARAQYDVATAAQGSEDHATEQKMYASSWKTRQARLQADPENVSLKKDLMITLARCGQHVEAARIGEEIRSLPEDGGSLVEVAGCYALCASAVDRGKDPATKSPEDQKLRAGYVVRSVTALKQAIAQGYRNVVNLETEPDLDSIRDNSEFTRLVDGMKGKR